MASGRQTLRLFDRPAAGSPPPAPPPPETTEILIGAYHAKPSGKSPPRGMVKMAEDLTELEIASLGPAPRGPGADPIIEAIAEGHHKRTLRWRNSGEHPLTLAFERGQITASHFAAGENLRVLCETLASTGKDSTDIERISGGGTKTPWTQRQAEAVQELAAIERRLNKQDWAICRKFCGEGYTMLGALRSAGIRFNKHRVTSRVCLALDYLAGNKKKGAHKRRNRRKAPAAKLTK